MEKILGMVLCPCHPRNGGKLETGDCVPGQLEKIQGPISKITRAKQAGSVVLALEHLTCKSKPLGSKPRSVKNNSNIFKDYLASWQIVKHNVI
jgi:hypothetical protein